QTIQKNLSIRHRIPTLSVNSRWNANALDTLALEKELALKIGTRKSTFACQSSFPYMDVQANQPVQLENGFNETASTVFDDNVPYILKMSKRVRESSAPKLSAMFPNVQTLHIWSKKPSVEALRFIIALCGSMGPQLITFNVWIEDLANI